MQFNSIQAALMTTWAVVVTQLVERDRYQRSMVQI